MLDLPISVDLSTKAKRQAQAEREGITGGSFHSRLPEDIRVENQQLREVGAI